MIVLSCFALSAPIQLKDIIGIVKYKKTQKTVSNIYQAAIMLYPSHVVLTVPNGVRASFSSAELTAVDVPALLLLGCDRYHTCFAVTVANCEKL